MTSIVKSDLGRHFEVAVATVSYNVTGNFQAGKALFCVMRGYQRGTPVALTLTIGGDTPTLDREVGGDSHGNRRFVRFYHIASPTGGSTAVQVTGPDATHDYDLEIDIVQIDDTFVALDVAGYVDTAALSVSPNAGSNTTSLAIAFAGCAGQPGLGDLGCTTPSGYTSLNLAVSQGAAGSSDYKLLGATGAQTVTYTTVNDLLVGGLVVYKLTASGGGGGSGGAGAQMLAMPGMF